VGGVEDALLGGRESVALRRLHDVDRQPVLLRVGVRVRTRAATAGRGGRGAVESGLDISCRRGGPGGGFPAGKCRSVRVRSFSACPPYHDEDRQTCLFVLIASPSPGVTAPEGADRMA